MMTTIAKKKLSNLRSHYKRLEQVVGCKWSVSILEAVCMGVNRPGALERNIEGISRKVLSERLRKLTDYGLLKKCVFPQIPPRTEYTLTKIGKKLVRIIAMIQKLDQENKRL